MAAAVGKHPKLSERRACLILGVPRSSLMEKALYACDELSGFITACALVRPMRLEGLEAKSVRKKLKNLAFAAAVSREDIATGIRELGVEEDAHIARCIAAIRSL